jgi:hypothetical protein
LKVEGSKSSILPGHIQLFDGGAGMTIKLPRLIATSVVRGSRQGESHGGVFMVDFEEQDGSN